MFISWPQNTLGKEMKTSFVLSATRALGDKLYYGSLCQYMSKHLTAVFFLVTDITEYHVCYMFPKNPWVWINRIVTTLPVTCLSAIVCLLFMVSDTE